MINKLLKVVNNILTPCGFRETLLSSDWSEHAAHGENNRVLLLYFKEKYYNLEMFISIFLAQIWRTDTFFSDCKVFLLLVHYEFIIVINVCKAFSKFENFFCLFFLMTPCRRKHPFGACRCI